MLGNTVMDGPTDLEVALRAVRRLKSMYEINILLTALYEQRSQLYSKKDSPTTRIEDEKSKWTPPNMRLIRIRKKRSEKPSKPKVPQAVSTLHPSHKTNEVFLEYKRQLTYISEYMLRHRIKRKKDCPKEIYTSFGKALDAWLLLKPSFKLNQFKETGIAQKRQDEPLCEDRSVTDSIGKAQLAEQFQ